MTEAQFHISKDGLRSAYVNGGIATGGIGSPDFDARNSLLRAFEAAFPQAKRAIRGGYIVVGDDAEARVRDWFVAQGKPLS